ATPASHSLDSEWIPRQTASAASWNPFQPTPLILAM
ncbi:MAG: hypothetical protein ACJA0V_004451, partial [Planctomycetota bacterium]